MSSKRSGGRGGSFGAAAAGSLNKGKSTGPQHGQSSGGFGSSNNGSKNDQLNHDVVDLSTDSAEAGEWEVPGKKSRNRGGNGAAKPRGASAAPPKAWGHQEMPQKQGGTAYGGTGNMHGSNWAQAADSKRHVGKGNMKPQPPNRGWEAAYMAPAPAIRPPLQHGWQWAARSQSKTSEDAANKNDFANGVATVDEDSGSDLGQRHPENDSDDDELVADSDEDLLSDDYDSDVSQKSYETRKKNRWFSAFFVALDKLTNEQISEPSRQWHCPACARGPGAIDWYRGLQPLMTHAKTKGSIRAMLHREFAELLEEELRRRGTSVIPGGEAFGKWKGLRETAADHDIVWPPMVVIRNTLLEKDEHEKWIGMGNQELLEYFSQYEAGKARHSYGPQGHRGISVLIFDTSARGYFEAERLHKHFVEEGTDREAWDRRRQLFYPGGRRQLYGYLACKEDLVDFNQHSQGKTKLKYEIRSYHEMVVGPLKQMDEDNQMLLWYKSKVARQQRNEKALQQTMGVMSNQLRITSEENRIVRLRTTIQHEENKEQMDYMETFFKDQVAAIHETLEAKERAFEKLLQEKRDKVKLSNSDSGSKEECKLRQEEIARFIHTQSKGIEEFEAEREKLVRAHDEKKAELKRKYLAAEVELEKELDAALTQLMEKYTPHPSESSAS